MKTSRRAMTRRAPGPHRAREIADLLARHGSVQLLTQGFAFLSGILIVRSMEKSEYAGYAICIALLSAVAGIAEGGLNSSLMSIGGQIRADRDAFSTLYSSVLRYRLIIGLPIIIVGTAGVGAVLLANNFDWWRTSAAMLLTGVSMWFALHSGTVYTVLRLDYAFRYIRTVNLVAAVARVALIVVVLLADLGGMETVLAIGLIIMFGANRIISREVRRALPAQPANVPLYKKTFHSTARRVMPMNVALILSEQAVLVFLTIYGATSSIAEIQAMARFGAVFVVVNGLLLDLATPYIARMPSGPELLTKGLVPIMGTYAILCTAIITMGALFNDVLLAILGDQYGGLGRPLVFVLIGLAIAQFSRAFGVLNQARGWLQHSWIYIPLILVWGAVSISHLDLTTIMGAALLMATQPLAELITQTVRFLSGYLHDQRARARNSSSGSTAAG